MSRPKNKRSSFSIESKSWDILIQEAERIGISNNAALNMQLAELHEWRSGKKRYVEARMPQAKAS